MAPYSHPPNACSSWRLGGNTHDRASKEPKHLVDSANYSPSFMPTSDCMPDYLDGLRSPGMDVVFMVAYLYRD